MDTAKAQAPLRGPWWGFLAEERPDPRVLQAGIAGLMAVDAFARELSGQGYGGHLFPTLGLTLLLVLTLGALPIRWQQVPVWTIAVLPVLDVLAIGLMRLTPTGGGSSVVVVLPAIWLARQFGRPGAATAVVSVVLLQALPGVLYLGADGLSLSRALLLPLVAGTAAYGVAVAMDAFRVRTEEAADRGHRLEGLTAELMQQQRVNETVLDTVDIGLLLIGPDGRYEAMNRRHQELIRIGYPGGHGGMSGQLGEVFREDGVTRLTREEMPTRRASLGEEFHDRRLWVGADLDKRRALSVSARSLRDENDDFAGAVLAYKDVTDLLRAVQVKDEFLATVSHELRTPLTSILGYVDLVLERDDLDSLVARQLTVVERNGQRLLRLVGDLLHTAQLSSGRLPLERGACDLVAVVRDCLAAARPAATSAGVLLEAEMPVALAAEIDRERVAQVMDNLLSNAVKYNRCGGSVTVRVTPVAGAAQVDVVDTGPGLLPEERERLFTRFYRARHAVDHAIPGAGLGLSISKAIVEAHGGRIEMDSTTGVGTRVRVTLPVCAAPEPAAPGRGDGTATVPSRD